MLQRIALLPKRLLAARGWLGVILVLGVVVLLWLASQVIWTGLAIALITGLVVATFTLARHDLPVLIGRGDPRPWLVRIREHHWTPIATPVGVVPRLVTYAGLLIAWWWLLS
ncbi:MAG: hypothetical protein AAGF31_04005 [Planctomycetota bacterium]